jgi:beta-lactamase class A
MLRIWCIFRVSPRSFGAVLLSLLLAGSGAFGATNSLAKLREKWEAFATAADGKVGVAAELIETRESVSMNGQDHYPMQSVYKFPIAMAVLHEVDQGKMKLDQKVQFTTNDLMSKLQNSPIRDAYPEGGELSVSNLLREMVCSSDGTACDVFLRLLGFDPVNAYLHSLGATNVMVATMEKEMGQDERAQYRSWATPEGMIGLLRALHEGRGLSPPSRKLLLAFMTESTPGRKRLKGLLPPGTPVAHKTGTSRTVNGQTAATNDVGIITLPDGRHVAIAVFVSDARADDTTRDAVIAKISKAAWDYWMER